MQVVITMVVILNLHSKLILVYYSKTNNVQTDCRDDFCLKIVFNLSNLGNSEFTN